MIHAFGDSFVVGDQDDFHGDPNTSKEFPPSHAMSYNERIEYLKYQVSFAALIAKELGTDFRNYAERGSGNYPQVDKLWLNCVNGNIKAGDLVIFGITTTCRDRISCMEFKKVVSDSHGELLIDRQLINTGKSSDIYELDLFYLLSILEKISKVFNIRIIKINLFDNSLDNATPAMKALFVFDDFVGSEFKGNTLIDILNDTWAQNTSHVYHDKLAVPTGYTLLYTNKKHPSIQGHAKIAQFLLNNAGIKWHG